MCSVHYSIVRLYHHKVETVAKKCKTQALIVFSSRECHNTISSEVSISSWEPTKNGALLSMRSLIALQSRLQLINAPCVMTSRGRHTAWHMAAKTWPYKVSHMDDMVCSTNPALHAFVTTFTDMMNGRVKVTNIEVNEADVDCNVTLSKLFRTTLKLMYYTVVNSSS